MHAQDIMTPCAVVCTQHTNLRDAAHLMIENHCRCLPVIDDHDATRTIIGVVSEHDMICRVVAEGLDPVMSTVWLAMTMPAEVVHDDATLEECILRLRHKQVEHLVVVDRHGAYRGIITQGDIARQRTPAPADNWSSTFSSPTAHTSSGRLIPARSSSSRLQAIGPASIHLPGSEPGDYRSGA